MIEKNIRELEFLLDQKHTSAKKLAKLLEKILKRIKIKRGEVADIVERHPYLEKQVERLVNDYMELHGTVPKHRNREKLKEWLLKLSNCKAKENCLWLDSYNRELGSDHF